VTDNSKTKKIYSATDITLTNVMVAIKRHKVSGLLSDGAYKLFIELVLEANGRQFNEPVKLTVAQALPLGGGNSRQTLYNRRNELKKLLIDGKHLVKITAGNYSVRSLATYEIDFFLLCSVNGMNTRSKANPSNELDAPLTEALRTLDAGLPTQREEKRRKDPKPDPPEEKPPPPEKKSFSALKKAIDYKYIENDESVTVQKATIMKMAEGQWGGKMRLTETQLTKMYECKSIMKFVGWTYWLDVIETMGRSDIQKMNGNAMIKYGIGMWSQYRVKNNITVYH